ncbi:MAG: RNA-binding cell elongation regulator Jag/EloR [Anaerolineae bacterium]
MPTSLEVRGRTVEEAIQKGLEELGLSRDQVEVELLAEGSRGLFGLRGAEAMVRLTRKEIVQPVVAAHVPPAAPAPAPAAPTPAPAAPFAETPETHKDPALVGQEALSVLLRGMGIPSKVEIHPGEYGKDGPDFVLDIVGADLGILIGRRGETLRDLEYITRLIVAQQVHHVVRFALDVEGYRSRRERQLRALATRMADQVRQSHSPMTLEAMPPHERRIIHLTLRDHPTVRTQSIGEEDHRRVMILPK